MRPVDSAVPGRGAPTQVQETTRPPRVRRPVQRLAARCLAIAAAAVLATGCSGSVVVGQAFPVPLVERLPLRVAVHYPPALADYVHQEDPEADRDWTVQLGPANLRMFDSVFSALFTESRQVTGVAQAAAEMPGFDAVIAPVVDAFEFSLPSQSATDQYAVWIRYNLDVYGADGQLITRWPVTAYGQSGTSGLSDEESMERATVLALRDAAATISTTFARQPKICEALLKEAPADGTPDPD